MIRTPDLESRLCHVWRPRDNSRCPLKLTVVCCDVLLEHVALEPRREHTRAPVRCMPSIAHARLGAVRMAVEDLANLVAAADARWARRRRQRRTPCTRGSCRPRGTAEHDRHAAASCLPSAAQMNDGAAHVVEQLVAVARAQPHARFDRFDERVGGLLDQRLIDVVRLTGRNRTIVATTRSNNDDICAFPPATHAWWPRTLQSSYDGRRLTSERGTTRRLTTIKAPRCAQARQQTASRLRRARVAVRRKIALPL